MFQTTAIFNARRKEKRRANKKLFVFRRSRVEELEDRRLLATWTGADDAFWGNPLNWQDNAVPVAGEDVFLNIPSSITLNVSPPGLGNLHISAAAAINSLGNDLVFENLNAETLGLTFDGGGTLTVNNAVTLGTGAVAAYLRIADTGTNLNATAVTVGGTAGATLYVSAGANATVTTLTANGPDDSQPGKVEVSGGSTLTIDDGIIGGDGHGSLRVSGTGSSASAITLSVGEGAHRHGGVGVTLGASLAAGTVTVGPNGEFNMHDDSLVTMAFLTIAESSDPFGSPIANGGLVTVNSGADLSVLFGVNVDGTLRVQDSLATGGTSLTVDGNLNVGATAKASVVFDGAAPVTIAGATNVLDGTLISRDADTTLTTLDIQPQGEVVISSSGLPSIFTANPVTVNGGLLRVVGPAATVTMMDTTVLNGGTVTVNGVSGGVPAAPPAGSTLTVTGAGSSFTATRSDVSLESVTVTSGGTMTVDDNSTSDDTATAGDDYAATAGTVSIPAGDLSATLSVAITNDALDEDNESFVVGLSNEVDVSLSDYDATGTITDNDAPPTVSVNSLTVDETAGWVEFIVSLSAASGKTITVDDATSSGTATQGDDYSEPRVIAGRPRAVKVAHEWASLLDSVLSDEPLLSI